MTELEGYQHDVWRLDPHASLVSTGTQVWVQAGKKGLSLSRAFSTSEPDCELKAWKDAALVLAVEGVC